MTKEKDFEKDSMIIRLQSRRDFLLHIRDMEFSKFFKNKRLIRFLDMYCDDLHDLVEFLDENSQTNTLRRQFTPKKDEE